MLFKCRSYDIIRRFVLFPFGLECYYYTAAFSLLQEIMHLDPKTGQPDSV